MDVFKLPHSIFQFVPLPTQFCLNYCSYNKSLYQVEYKSSQLVHLQECFDSVLSCKFGISLSLSKKIKKTSKTKVK